MSLSLSVVSFNHVETSSQLLIIAVLFLIFVVLIIVRVREHVLLSFAPDVSWNPLKSQLTASGTAAAGSRP